MDLETLRKKKGESIMRLNTKLTESKKQKGITLIALVVTIVVLLILAGVSVNALFGSNGIIEKAKEAQNKMDKAKANDLEGINELTNWIGNQVNGTTDDNKSNTLKSYEDASKENGILKENAVYTDNENAKVTIPKGFKVSDVAATANSDGEQTVSKGLVIQDKDGNEFVWIPVEYTATEVDSNNNGLDDGFETTFKRTTSDRSFYYEPYAKGYAEEESDYIKMMKSVQKNRGFYIGRYETGTTIPRTDSTTTTSTMVVKRDAYPYIYIGWGNELNDITTEVTYQSKVRGKGATYLSQTMYPDTSKYTNLTNDTGVVSTLCYGVQWDAIMNFIADTNNISDSKEWGNYPNNIYTIDRQTAKYTDMNKVSTGGWTNISDTTDKKYSKTKSSEILLTTGASDSFKAKNIFDLAGNSAEWTMEVYDDDDITFTHVGRGGHYTLDGTREPSSFRRYYEPKTSSGFLAFRIALYL